MGQLSLYRQYRPQTFAEVIGQEHVTRTLQNALAEDRVAHAYLFTGPRGTGKTSTARILAKALNCEEGPGREPCNACASCQQITQGTYVDVIEIDAASHGSVEDARDLREKVAYAPVTGRRKVYIIDECHMLSAAANNALLKVLEEPPAHVTFLFATTEPNKVLQTLLDRCQRYELRAASTEAIASRIDAVSQQEGVALEDEAISLLASRASGSIRDALGLLDQVTSFAGKKVTREDVAGLFGSIAGDLKFEVVDLISERDIAGCFAFADRLVRSGTDLKELARSLVDHLRALFLIQHASGAQDILDVSDETLERLRAQANRFEGGELLRILDLAGETYLGLKEGVDGRLALEVGLARMARPELHASPASLVARLERLERLAGIEPEATGAPGAPRSPARPEASPRTRPEASPRARPEASPSRPETSPRARPPRPAPPAPAGDPVPTIAAAAPEAAAIHPAPSSDPHEAPPAEAPRRDPGEPPNPSELDLEKIRRGWKQVLEGVKKRKISAQAMLHPATVQSWLEGELVLEFSERHGFHRDQVSLPAYRTPLMEAFFETFGVRPAIRCVMGKDDQDVDRAAVSDSPRPGDDEGGDTALDPIDLIREGFAAEVVEELGSQ